MDIAARCKRPEGVEIMMDPKFADSAEVVILQHRDDPNIAVVEFDTGEGNAGRIVTTPANVKALAIRMYAAARSIMGESKIDRERLN
jgi:hypothetical protein